MTDKAERRERADLEALIGQPGFLRFLSRVIQSAGIYAATTNGTDGRYLVSEGRRDLGLNILRDAARGIPLVDDPAGALGLLLIQVLREEAQSTPQEIPRGRKQSDDTDESDA